VRLFFIVALFKFIIYPVIISEKYTLKKDERLKSRKIIQQLFKEGKSFSVFPFRVIYIEEANPETYLKAAFSVSSKNFKKAVDRNRIKRLMRECYRLQKKNLEKQLTENKKSLVIFLIYTKKELPEYQFVFEKMGTVIFRIKEIIENNK
jgi:ribonuclease P protein component